MLIGLSKHVYSPCNFNGMSSISWVLAFCIKFLDRHKTNLSSLTSLYN